MKLDANTMAMEASKKLLEEVRDKYNFKYEKRFRRRNARNVEIVNGHIHLTQQIATQQIIDDVIGRANEEFARQQLEQMNQVHIHIHNMLYNM